MKKPIKKIITLLITVGVLLSCLVFTASAAGSTISFSSNNPKVNDSVTVTVTVSSNESIFAIGFSLKYNPDILKYESGDGTGGAGVLNVVISNNSNNVKSNKFSFVFTAIAAGSSNIQIADCNWVVGMSNEEAPFTGASASITVSDAAKSDNANLKSLSLSKGTLSPKFSASKTSYTATVATSVTEVKVYATAQDSGAKVEIAGEAVLKDGENIRTVTVTAPSGAQKVYTIKITRSDLTAEPEPEVPEVNPLETTVDGASYIVLNDISGIALPAGFSVATAEFNGTEVPVAKDADGNYTLYYLKAADSEAVEPYLLSGDAFERLQHVAIGDKIYIFADLPAELTASEGYYETAVKIGDFSVKAFAVSDSEFTDFYYVYCFYDNGFRIYRYDSKENVLQRAPEFKLVSVEEKEIGEADFLTRFKSLSTNAKTVVIGLLLAALGAIALIVLLTVKLVKGRKEFADDDYSDMLFEPDFDEVTVDDGSKAEEGPDNEKQD